MLEQNYRHQTKELNRVEIHEVAKLFGKSLPETGSTHCPFPDHEDKHPSFLISSSRDRWICLGCNRKGDSIDFVKSYNNLSFPEAKDWLAEHLTEPAVPPSLKQASQSCNNEMGAEPDIEVYERFLNHCPLLDDGRNYLTGHAISEETINNFRIGQIENNEKVADSMRNIFGLERLKSAGSIFGESDLNPIRLISPDQNIVFPFLKNGQAIHLQIEHFGSTGVNGRWRNPLTHRNQIYNIDALAASTSEPIAICEGVMNTLSAIELGYVAVGLMGATGSLAPDQLLQLRDRQVHILLDWDHEGNKKANNLQQMMNNYGIVSTRIFKPQMQGKKLNDYLIETKELQ